MKTHNPHIHLCMLCFIVLGLNSFTMAQGEGNVWYFGYEAGLDFNNGSPVAINNGQMNIWEGCTAMSDTAGNLLFYSDGVYVWNADHDTMTNGTGLLGEGSVTQSVVAIPRPAYSNRYFLFTTDALENGFNNGLRYSEIDMSLQGGLGEVIVKNQLLFQSNTERVTAVPHGNGTDFWVVAHRYFFDEFYAYQVDSSGVINSPVITNIGTAHSNPALAQGAIKISPQGDKLAVALKQLNMVEVFDFDNLTGMLSNALSIQAFPELGWAYGLAFSCDGTKLYCTGVSNDKVIQIDLAAGSDSAIIQSLMPVATLPTYSGGTMTLGPDQKIYITMDNQEYLGVIHNPNLAGPACNVEDSAIYLNGAITGFGLPNLHAGLYPCERHGEVGIAQGFETIPLNLYPNPSSGADYIQFQHAYGLEKLALYDMMGRKIREWTLPASEGPKLFVGDVMPGVYGLKATDTKGRLYSGQVWIN